MSRLSGTTWYLPVGAAVAVLAFLFAVQLLGTATDAAAPVVEGLFRRYVAGDAPALGLGWLGAYVLGNGSVVAALSLSLFAAEVVTTGQAFLLVAGSRLGGAGIVLFVGALDYVQKARYSLRRAVSLGLLTFLLTLSVFLPATALGYVTLPVAGRAFAGVGSRAVLGGQPLAFFAPFTSGIEAAVGPLPAAVLAVALLFVSLRLFDAVLGAVDTETLRERVFVHLRRTWVSFALGLVVTGVTTSVAFSLGVVVPLYNRGYVEREELVPYVLGANLGTFLDTLVVAAVLESPDAVAVVLHVLATGTLLTLAALAVHDRYVRVVVAADDRLREDPRLFAAFVLALAVVPAGLLVVPLVLR